MGAVDKITIDDKTYFYIDYRPMTVKEMIEAVYALRDIIIKENKPYLHIANVEDTPLSTKFIKHASVAAKETATLLDKGAIVGLRGIRKIVLQGYNLSFGEKNGLKPFNSLREAKEYILK